MSSIQFRGRVEVPDTMAILHYGTTLCCNGNDNAPRVQVPKQEEYIPQTILAVHNRYSMLGYLWPLGMVMASALVPNLLVALGHHAGELNSSGGYSREAHVAKQLHQGVSKNSREDPKDRTLNSGL